LETEVKLRPVGVVRVGASDEEVSSSLSGVPGVVEVFPEFAEGLEGIDGFSHLILVAYLHKVPSERKALKVRPKHFAKLGISINEVPEVGVFCTDSPRRPNPIALSIVRLVKREGRLLYVEGLDLFDGTPVLDIRAYTPDRAVLEAEVPKWYRELLERAKHGLGAGERS